MHKEALKEPYGPEMFASAASQRTQGTEEIGSTRAQVIAGNLTTILLMRWSVDMVRNIILVCQNIVLKMKPLLIPRED